MKTAQSSALVPAALVAATCALLPASAFAFAEVARGALTLTTTGRIAYDSNLSGNTMELGDTVFTLAPTLNYNRAAGLGTIDASLGTAINRYADLTAFNSEDYFGSLRVSLPTPDGARQQGAFNLSYADRTDIDEDAGTRVRAKAWNAGFAGTFRAGPRTNVRANFNYSDTNRDILTDQTRWSAGLGFDYTDFLGGCGLEGDYRYSATDSTTVLGLPGTALDQKSHHVSTGLFYKFASGLRASADVGYRWIDRLATETISGQTSSNSPTFSIRLDGPFLPPSRFPKLTSSFSIGLQKGETLGLNDNGGTTVVGDLSLAWQARERTALTVSASRRQEVGSTNLGSVNNSLRFGVKQQIGERTHLNATIGQDWLTYPGTDRDDRRTRASLDLACALNRSWQVGTGYTLTLSRSSSDFLDYDRHLVHGFVSYTF